jgi:hypothetical protein
MPHQAVARHPREARATPTDPFAASNACERRDTRRLLRVLLLIPWPRALPTQSREGGTPIRDAAMFKGPLLT